MIFSLALSILAQIMDRDVGGEDQKEAKLIGILKVAKNNKLAVR